MAETLLQYLFWILIPGFVLTVIVGMIASWIARKVSALVQWRVGPPLLQPLYDVGKLIGKEALEIAKMAYSSDLLEAAIGMAAINSLLEIDEEQCLTINAGDLLDEKGRNKKVALIGHFPFVPELRRVAKDLWVIEQHPQEEDLAEDKTESLIPQADVVGITGTSLTNHTLDYLLDLCHHSFIVLIGPTSPLSPVLFDYGVDVIGGTQVVNQERAIRCINEGAIFRQMEGVKLLNMVRYNRK